MSQWNTQHDLIEAAHATQALEDARRVWLQELPAARADAVALTTAVNAQLCDAFAAILTSWVGLDGAPAPRTYVLADELLALAARVASDRYLRAGLPATAFPDLQLAATAAPASPAVDEALSLVAPYVHGNLTPVRLAFGRHLGPAADAKQALRFLSALAVSADTCTRYAAGQAGVQPAALLAEQGVRAAR